MTGFSVAGALDRYVESLEEERLPDGHWHPSSLFGCARRAVYDFLGTPKAPIGARTKRVFRVGHIFHELIQTAVAASPAVKEAYAEVKIVDPVRKIKGHADELILVDEDGEDVWGVLEFKSIKSTGMKYSDLPKDDHRKQVATYCDVLREYGGLVKIQDPAENVYNRNTTEIDGELYIVIPPLGDLARVRFAYVSKDDLEIKEFEQIHTDAKGEWVTNYIKGLEVHVANGTLPKRLVRLTPKGKVSKQRPWPCSYCPFADKCWAPEEPEGVD